MAGSAIWSRFAGHSGRSAKSRHALSLNPDHPIGAGQSVHRFGHAFAQLFVHVHAWLRLRSRLNQ